MKTWYLTILLIMIALLLVVMSYQKKDNNKIEDAQVVMNIIIYKTTREGESEPLTVQVPKTEGVANASLKYLFENNLSVYGDYVGVNIINGIAYVTLAGNLPGERTFSSLSSTEIFDLNTTIYNTLIQYPTINEVILLDLRGQEISF